jgi:NADH dehydrogenase FAD-containing subunit
MEYVKRKVVILGGGNAGLMTAVTLQKKVHPSRIEIILVNKNDYHYFTTKVHEAGAGTVNPDAIKMTFIWAGGIKGNPLLEGLGLELLDGRVRLNEYCEVPGYHDVYVLGDTSVSLNEKGEPYPPTAQIAIQQGQYCAYSIAMKIYGQQVKPFHYIYRGMVLSLGKGNASGIVYNHHISGHIASFMKWVIEMRYYFMLGGTHLVRKQWKR